MESHNLEMGDLFDNDVGVDDDFDDIGAAPMPGLDEEGDDEPMNEHAGEEDGDDEEGEGGDVLAKLRALKRGAAKKRVMKPQPKLDGIRLKGDRGLAILPKLFEDVQFKGKGHEARDLKLMMNKLEHWGHRLFPKMTFDELIARLEKLGAKKDVQTCIKRIRLDMPVLDEDFTAASLYQEDEEEEENKAAQAEPADDFDAEEAYDEMMRQEREARAARIEEGREAEPTSLTSPEHRRPDAHSFSSDTPRNKTPQNQTSDQTPQHGLTPDQKERLERNKLRALEKRAARLGVPVSTLVPSNKPDASQNGKNTGSDSARSENESSKESQNYSYDDIDMNAQVPNTNESNQRPSSDISDSNNVGALRLSGAENIALASEHQLNSALDPVTDDSTAGVGTLQMTCTENETTEKESHVHLQSGKSDDNDSKDIVSVSKSNNAQSPIPQIHEPISSSSTVGENDENVATDVIATAESDKNKHEEISPDDGENDTEIAETEDADMTGKAVADVDTEESEEELGLRLQLSDTTNTTQEEEDSATENA